MGTPSNVKKWENISFFGKFLVKTNSLFCLSLTYLMKNVCNKNADILKNGLHKKGVKEKPRVWYNLLTLNLQW